MIGIYNAFIEIRRRQERFSHALVFFHYNKVACLHLVIIIIIIIPPVNFGQSVSPTPSPSLMYMGSTDLGQLTTASSQTGHTDHLVANGRNGGGGNSPLPQLADDNVIHKTILVGDSGVGKTSLLVQFDQGKFQSGSFAATVGIGFTNKVVSVDDFKVKLQIWDTAGQERFRSITHAYYRDAHALLLLYDVTSKTSFDNISAWLAEINEYAQDDVVIMLIGNKSDMFGERAVRKEDGETVAREFGVGFLETSAKTAMNVDLAFKTIARDLKLKKTRRCDSKFQVSGTEREDSYGQKSAGCC